MPHWIVWTPTAVAIVEDCTSEKIAREKAIVQLGVANKPWLGRDWVIRVATSDELRLYAAQADGLAKSQPTARVAKDRKKKVRDRLF